MPSTASAPQEEGDSLEEVPLISHTVPEQAVASPTEGGSSGGEAGRCRICLEDDELTNLEEPCACKGTLQRAHRACLQRWINERDPNGNQALVCEICKAPYTGGYTPPPPPPPRRNRRAERLLVLVVDPETGLASTRTHMMAAPDADSDEDEDDYVERLHPARACFASFVLFTMCSFLILHLFTILPSNVGPGGDFPQPATQDDADAQFQDVSATLLLLWLFARVLVLVAPVYTLTRVMAGRRWETMHRWQRQGDSEEEIELDEIVVHQRSAPDGDDGDIEQGLPNRAAAPVSIQP